MTLCPLAASAGGREPHTSPRPPVFDQGATCSRWRMLRRWSMHMCWPLQEVALNVCI